MAKKSKKFQNDYLFNLKGRLMAEQMIGDSYKKAIANVLSVVNIWMKFLNDGKLRNTYLINAITRLL